MKKQVSHALSLLVAGLIVLGGVAVLAATGPTMVQDVISGGGGTSAFGQVEIVDTVGQPMVGAANAGGMSLVAGFWAGDIASVTTPALPTATATAKPTPTRTPTPGGGIQLPLVQRNA